MLLTWLLLKKVVEFLQKHNETVFEMFSFNHQSTIKSHKLYFCVNLMKINTVNLTFIVFFHKSCQHFLKKVANCLQKHNQPYSDIILSLYQLDEDEQNFFSCIDPVRKNKDFM